LFGKVSGNQRHQHIERPAKRVEIRAPALPINALWHVLDEPNLPLGIIKGLEWHTRVLPNETKLSHR
jgi:hypothetical protein